MEAVIDMINVQYVLISSSHPDLHGMVYLMPHCCWALPSDLLWTKKL